MLSYFNVVCRVPTFFLNALGATNIPGSEGWKEKMNRRR